MTLTQVGYRMYEMQLTTKIKVKFLQIHTPVELRNLFCSFEMISVTPRVLFEQFSDKDFSKLLTYEQERAAVIQLILKTCQKHKFNGIVLEIWSQLAVRVEDEYLVGFVTEIGE